MNDPRANLPSASAYAITEACPGSENIIRSIPGKTEEEADEQALRGTRIHSAWETGDTSDLSQDEIADYNESIATLNQALADWKDQVGATEVQEIREQRLWLNDPSTMEPILSGQFDRLYLYGNEALNLDLKSGWCRTLTRADENRQIRVLNVLIWKEYGVTSIRGAFVKPKLRRQLDAVHYTESDLIHSEAQIHHSIWKSKQPDAQRVPGSHCNYCPAKSFCPEAGAYSMLPSVMVNAIETKDAQMMVERLAIEDLALIQSRASIIGKILDEVKARLKSLPAEELRRVGLEIGRGKKLDPIKDTKGAFDALVKFGVKEEELWQALSFSKGELVKAVMRDQGWAKKPTEGWLWDQELKQFIEPKQSEGSLDRI